MYDLSKDSKNWKQFKMRCKILSARAEMFQVYHPASFQTKLIVFFQLLSNFLTGTLDVNFLQRNSFFAILFLLVLTVSVQGDDTGEGLADD